MYVKKLVWVGCARVHHTYAVTQPCLKREKAVRACLRLDKINPRL